MELFGVCPVVFSLQVERVFPRKIFMSCVCYLFPHPTGFRNKVLIPNKKKEAKLAHLGAPHPGITQIQKNMTNSSLLPT